MRVDDDAAQRLAAQAPSPLVRSLAREVLEQRKVEANSNARARHLSDRIREVGTLCVDGTAHADAISLITAQLDADLSAEVLWSQLEEASTSPERMVACMGMATNIASTLVRLLAQSHQMDQHVLMQALAQSAGSGD